MKNSIDFVAKYQAGFLVMIFVGYCININYLLYLTPVGYIFIK